jgi:hypothetical protein
VGLSIRLLARLVCALAVSALGSCAEVTGPSPALMRAVFDGVAVFDALGQLWALGPDGRMRVVAPARSWPTDAAFEASTGQVRVLRLSERSLAGRPQLERVDPAAGVVRSIQALDAWLPGPSSPDSAIGHANVASLAVSVDGRWVAWTGGYRSADTNVTPGLLVRDQAPGREHSRFLAIGDPWVVFSDPVRPDVMFVGIWADSASVVIAVRVSDGAVLSSSPRLPIPFPLNRIWYSPAVDALFVQTTYTLTRLDRATLAPGGSFGPGYDGWALRPDGREVMGWRRVLLRRPGQPQVETIELAFFATDGTMLRRVFADGPGAAGALTCIHDMAYAPAGDAVLVATGCAHAEEDLLDPALVGRLLRVDASSGRVTARMDMFDALPAVRIVPLR